MSAKNIAVFICSLALSISPEYAFPQILEPVKWSFITEQKGGEATLVFKAKMDGNFHIYSQFLAAEGPIPTSFFLNPSNDYMLTGKTTEEKGEEEYDANFDMQLKYFSHQAEFRQKVKILNSKPFQITGVLTFMACDESRCLPPEDVDFTFAINESAQAAWQNSVNEKEAIPIEKGKDTLTANRQQLSGDTLIISELEPGCGTSGDDEESYDSAWGIFIGGIFGGLLALLTPCVFPMIPLTVSFFTKSSRTRKRGIVNAIMYAVFIILIYVGLGLLVTVTLGSDALNELASNAFFNLAFFIIFIIFALSFFGAFEIVLPSSLVNQADAASDKGGIIGIFFMAFTLSLVSFSCTGPIIGTLLVEAAHGRSYLGPLAGMTGFAVALALPFAFFAAFPGWLNSLPKSGGWLNSVKVTLGFLELALAMKFLSNVDLAYHWGILKREVFLSFWIIIFALMGFYLLGKLKFSHDTASKNLSIPRLILAILTFSFTLYLIPGLWGAPLKLISGFPPPDFYKEWRTEAHDCPHGLHCFHNYDEGIAYAKSQGKPVIIDFTGWSCVNCRKMEDNVWSDPKVLQRLSEEYVLISLYVDDKEQLPDEQKYTSRATGKKIKTMGNKWSEFQAVNYQTNSQPYYVLIDFNEKLLARPRGYTPDIDSYLKFLDEGLCRNKKRTQS